MTAPYLQKSVRTIAVLEAVKGAFVLIVGVGLLRLLHKDVYGIACDFISRIDLNPSHKIAKLFIELAANTTDHRIWFFAGFALVYSTFRFVQGYGLWAEKVWAEWLAVASGTIYLPIEMYEIYSRFTFLRVFALLANIAVIGIVAFLLIQKRRQVVNNSTLALPCVG